MNPILAHQLKTLLPFLRQEDLIELSVVRPQEVWLEIEGKGYALEAAPQLTEVYWRDLCQVLANLNGVKFDLESQPRVSTVLPGGHRFEALLGRTSRFGPSISIRMKRPLTKTLEDFGLKDVPKTQVLKAIKEGQSILISGGTSSGKTTLLNLLAREISLEKRILSVEDTSELDLPHPNWLSTIVSRNEANPAISYPQVIDHFMRSRPDIVIAGELSIANTYPIISLLDTGHKGFMCTVHSNSPTLALQETIPMKARLAGFSDEGMSSFLHKTVDMVIQVQKVGQNLRQVTQIWEPAMKTP